MKNMILPAKILVILSLSCHAFIGKAQDIRDALVRIYSIRQNDSGKSGTGFFIRMGNSLYVCTAYHVVQGGNYLKIMSSDGELADVRVAAYDNTKDIILLRFTDNKLGTKKIYPLSLLNNLPAGLIKKDGDIYGHPNTFSLRHEKVFFGSDHLRPSKEFSDDNKPIFRLGLGLDLLDITTTAYGGMSGGPILLDNRVLGIFSGSLNKGGSIGWAIPGQYIAQLHFLTVPMIEIKRLPDIDMFSPQLNTSFVRNFQIDESIEPKYQDLSRQIETFRAQNDEFEQHLRSHITYIAAFKQALLDKNSFEAFRVVFKNYIADHNARIKKTGEYVEMNSGNVSRWSAFIPQLNEDINNAEFRQYKQAAEGRKIFSKLDQTQLDIISIEPERVRLGAQETELLGIVGKAEDNNDYLTFKTKYLEILGTQSAMAAVIIRMIHVQDNFLDISAAIRDALVESQKYL